MAAAESERGSALLLVPAGVLVLFVLAALALDSAVAFLGQRALTDAAAAAANDAAALGLSDAAFYGSPDGPLVIDGAAAARVADAALRRQAVRGVVVIERVVEVAGDAVCIRFTGEVRRLFSPVVPGVSPTAVVHGRAVASAVRGQPGTPVEAAKIDC